jgi:hypothetical protein
MQRCLKMELEFVSSNELIAELQKRFEYTVFVGQKRTSESVSNFELYYSGGGDVTALGLLEMGKDRILKKRVEDVE